VFNQKRKKEHQEFLRRVEKISLELKQEQTPRKILIVDDDNSLNDFLTAVLSKEGYSISVSNSLAEFETELLLRDCIYDMLLLDIGLSNGDGLDWIEEVRNAGCITPVIVMTAYPSYERQKRAYELGVKSFIEKPIRVDRLLSRLREVL